MQLTKIRLQDHKEPTMQLDVNSGRPMKASVDFRGLAVFTAGLVLIGFSRLLPEIARWIALFGGAALLAACDFRGRTALAAAGLTALAMAAAIAYVIWLFDGQANEQTMIVLKVILVTIILIAGSFLLARYWRARHSKDTSQDGDQ